MNNRLNYYLDLIENSIYEKLDDIFFNDLLEEGFPYEIENGTNIDSWVKCSLKLKEEDRIGLIEFKEETVDFFNELDIEIKNKYNLKIIDFIDYDAGIVYIIKHIKN